ncbi:hypothetical protein HT585_20680 [Ensifer sp. HO-A22]|uniref:Uncharacterized protein n=1 Tax=Ensifer oleiphilus TaxID=2742698 RepID=A0A7Y6UPF0_9HYPH|nr:hypothetical protein [Ensifer oleiphilus]NVD41295.1 hypothetical protein [Ensifer oleiphilus]
MAEPVNGARGEVSLIIDGVELVIAATMGGLAAVSTRLNCKSMSDLFLRLSSVEIAATIAAIELLTVRGDVRAALSRLNLKHFGDCAAAFEAALSAHLGDDEGNAEAVGAETASPTT